MNNKWDKVKKDEYKRRSKIHKREKLLYDINEHYNFTDDKFKVFAYLNTVAIHDYLWTVSYERIAKSTGLSLKEVKSIVDELEKNESIPKGRCK